MLTISLTKAQHKIHSFFNVNLFERLVVYLLFSKLLASFYAEIILGQSLYYFPQASQWIFFTLLALDYVISYKKILLLKFHINAQSLFAILLFVMIIHGTFVGIINNNKLFTIFNDVVPPLMIALNILRMQSFSEINNIDLKRILVTASWICILQAFISIASGKTLSFSFVYFAIFATAIFTSKKIPLYVILIFTFYMTLALPDWNRTTLVSVSMILFIFLVRMILSKPLNAILITGVTTIAIALVFMNLPEDSRLLARLNGNIDLSSRTGSVGERQAEWEAIQTTLEQKGLFYEWTGLGMGGTYTVKFTHGYIKDYGHAHYAWAWFTLRFGNTGLIYMFLLFSLLLYIAKDIFKQDDQRLLPALLSIFGLLYMFTFVNGVWLTSGLLFFRKRN